MNRLSENMDMLHGALAKKLLLFTLPIALSSMLQQLFNAVDTCIAGMLGDAGALAAVGTNTEPVALIVTVSSGLSTGVNLLIANRIGRREMDGLPDAVWCALRLALITGAAAALAGQFAAGALLRLIQTPEGVFPSAVHYLRIYLAGYPFLLLYDFGAAVLRARGDSRRPFFALVISGIVNVLLNLLLAVVLRLGVAGVAIATAASNALSAGIILRRLCREGLLCRTCGRPHKGAAAEILRIGVPSAIQGAVFCFANIFVQAAVNRFGAAAIAGSAIAMNFEYFAYYAITAFGQTAATFTGQNHAAGACGRCRKILWLCMGFSTLCSLAMTAPAAVFRTSFAGLFSGDSAVIESACTRMGCVLLFEPLCNLYEIPAGVLKGSGHAALPAACTMTGTCVFRIVWICTVFRAHPSPELLYRAFPLSWIVTAVLIALGFAALRPLYRNCKPARRTQM